MNFFGIIVQAKSLETIQVDGAVTLAAGGMWDNGTKGKIVNILKTFNEISGVEVKWNDNNSVDYWPLEEIKIYKKEDN